MMEAGFNDVPGNPDATLRTGRQLSAAPARVFAAFSNPDELSRWWGPKDFTNTFDTFEFTPGGRWIFTMHAPGGTDHANEMIFRVIEPDARIVVDHVVFPLFRLTVRLSARDESTHLQWEQEFENAETADKFRPLAGTANEQVLDRLEAVLADETI